MPERHLLPIPLPHGRDRRTGYLSVFLSPRLREEGVLSDYREWTRWPDFVDATTFRVTVDGVVVPSTVVSAPPDLSLWATTFTGDTPVRAHRFEDWTEVELVKVPTATMHEALLDLYTDVAVAHPTQPPNGSGLLGVPSSNLLSDGDGVLDQTLDALAPMEGDEGDEVLDEPRDPMWDFHSYVSLLGAHPDLMRQLGLIVDLEVRLPPTPSSVTVETTYAAQFGPSGGFEVPIAMRTTDDFLAQPHPDLREQEDGFLLLSGSFASILDSAGSAGRLASLAAQTLGADDDGSLPVLSTRALTLVRPDQTAILAKRMQRQAQLERQVVDFLGGAPIPVAFAEDVSRGHRVDVLDHTAADETGPQWRSLFERTSAEGYHFPDKPALDRDAPDDEGWGQILLSTELVEELPKPDPDNHDPVVRRVPRRLSEALHRWDNWSGAVPRPANSVDAAGDLVPPDDGLPLPDDQPVRFAVDYQARPGSLPRLRCTHAYQMRARAVDLAGWSPAVTDKHPDRAATAQEVFGRLEPIAAPTVIRRDARPTPGVGDTATTIVLLSDYDVDDAEVEAQERILFPEAVGHDLVELHGLPAGGADPASYRELVDRSAASSDDDWGTDPATGEPLAGGEPRHKLSYLVDPMVGRVRAEHYGEGEVYHLASTGEWPTLMSSRVVAVAGEGASEVNPDDATDLRVHVEKADITGIDLSYAPPDGMLDHFGLWHQFTEDEQEALVDGIVDGAHWMFSGRRRLSFVHAVRRPLDAPAVATLELADRVGDSTSIRFTSNVAIDRRSTGALALRARWTDLVDDPTEPAPAPRSATTLLGRFDTPRSTDSAFDITDHRSELGDTKRHVAFVEAEAYSAFSSYFTEQREVTVETGTALELDDRGVAAGTVVIVDEDGHRAEPRRDFLVKSRAGVLRFPVSSHLTAGTRVTVRYVPLPISRTSDEHGPGFEVLVPNTAVPSRPTVLEAAPAFARPGVVPIEHDGRVIRVHLARPWNSTGDGEAIAVLVDPSRTAGTRLARDPIVTDRTTVPAPTVDDFPLASSTVTSDDGRFELAIHEATFDEELGHWIVDIAIETNLYRPFVQLVIARYQADSIEGRDVGPSVTLDPIRVGVARQVKHAVAGTTHTITVSGADHDGKPTVGTTTNEIFVRLQEADPTIADPDLAWTTDVSSVMLERTVDDDGSTWTGAIDVPDATVRRRLVIEEVEPASLRGEPATAAGQIVYTEVVDIAG